MFSYTFGVFLIAVGTVAVCYWPIQGKRPTNEIDFLAAEGRLDFGTLWESREYRAEMAVVNLKRK